jgi:DDE family transposase
LRPSRSVIAGKVLASTGTLVNDGATLLYRASKYDCDACELKPRCCPKMPARKVPRSIYENARDVARDIAKTETYVTSRRERKKIEMLFAHLKRIQRLDRLRLRGPSGAQDEFLLAATVQNAYARPMPCSIPINWAADFFNTIGAKRSLANSAQLTPDCLQNPSTSRWLVLAGMIFIGLSSCELTTGV